MAFSATFVGWNTHGKYKEAIWTFAGVSGDTGGTFVSKIVNVLSITISGQLSDGSANIAALAAGETSTDGTLRVSYTDPTANHDGIIVVRGLTR